MSAIRPGDTVTVRGTVADLSGVSSVTPDYLSGQVCQVHGSDDDLIICPYRRCQVGKVPLWWGNGMPAGVRECSVCDGRGYMSRAEARNVFLPIDDAANPPCICHRLAVTPRGEQP